MGKRHESISPELATFIEAQPLFFVATAPLAAAGHVNISPKGLDTLRILNPRRVAYLDLTGSGNDTAAHVSEYSRITFMLCSFDKEQKIVRIFGAGSVVLPGSSSWPGLIGQFGDEVGIRQIIVVEIEFVQTSCGFGVPVMELVANRDAMARWATAKGPEGLRQYRLAKNQLSIDGLPAPLPDRPE